MNIECAYCSAKKIYIHSSIVYCVCFCQQKQSSSLQSHTPNSHTIIGTYSFDHSMHCALAYNAYMLTKPIESNNSPCTKYALFAYVSQIRYFLLSHFFFPSFSIFFCFPDKVQCHSHMLQNMKNMYPDPHIVYNQHTLSQCTVICIAHISCIGF